MWAHIYDGPNDDVVCEVSAVYVSVCVCVLIFRFVHLESVRRELGLATRAEVKYL